MHFYDSGKGKSLANLNEAQIALAKKVEMAIESEIRRVLEALGMSINKDTEMDVVKRQMEIMGIKVIHVEYLDNPKLNGFHIFQHEQPLLIICDPKIEGNRIVIERRFP